MSKQLERICTSFEMSSRLKKAGIDLDTIFYWADGVVDGISDNNLKTIVITGNNFQSHEIIPESYEGEYCFTSVGCGCCASDFYTKEVVKAYTTQQLMEYLILTDNYMAGLELNEKLRDDYVNYKPDAYGETILMCIENNLINI